MGSKTELVVDLDVNNPVQCRIKQGGIRLLNTRDQQRPEEMKRSFSEFLNPARWRLPRK